MIRLGCANNHSLLCDPAANWPNSEVVWQATDSEKSYLPLPMPDKKLVDDQPVTRKKYTPAFRAECVRQVAAGARQTNVARAQGISPALLGRWQRAASEHAVPSSAARDESKRLRTEPKRMEIERDILKKVVISACF